MERMKPFIAYGPDQRATSTQSAPVRDLLGEVQATLNGTETQVNTQNGSGRQASSGTEGSKPIPAALKPLYDMTITPEGLG